MPSTTATAGRKTARKSPLRVATELTPITLEEPDTGPATARGGPGRDATGLSVPELRRLMISEYRDWLRSRTKRHGRPFQGDTVSAYADAVIALDAWMRRERIDADFTACDTAMLNRFFAAWGGPSRCGWPAWGDVAVNDQNLRSFEEFEPERRPGAGTWRRRPVRHSRRRKSTRPACRRAPLPCCRRAR